MPCSLVSFQRHLFKALVFLFVGGALSALLFQQSARGETEFLSAERAFELTARQPSEAGKPVELHWKIAPGYYLYRDRIEVESTPQGALRDVTRPPGEHKVDPNFGAMEVYHDAVAVQVDAGTARELSVIWQGCAEAGLCYPPQTRKIALAASPVDAERPAAASWRTVATGSDGAIQRMLASNSLAWTLPLFLLLGIALAFTPCVLPMVPIVSSIVVGSQVGPRRAFALTLAFVLPMALTYAGLGVAAALAGANLQAWLQNRWALLAFGAIFAVLALGMFGFFELQLPAFLRNRLDRASQGRRGGTLIGAASLGSLSALLVGPCMTAPLAGALLYIAQSGNALQGGLLLFSLGLGMGIPLLVVGTVGARFLPRPGPWMNRVKGLFGFLLLGTAIWMVERVISPSVTLALWGALCLGVALTAFQLMRPAEGHPGMGIVVRSSALVIGIWGTLMIFGAAGGGSDPFRPVANLASGGPNADRASRTPMTHHDGFDTVRSPQELQVRLAEAKVAGKPVLVDFYADWCVSCKSIEMEVFGNEKVRRALSGVVLLRADVTLAGPPQQALMRDHQVIGPPTVMLFDAQGNERRDARLVGDFDADDLLRRAPAGKGRT